MPPDGKAIIKDCIIIFFSRISFLDTPRPHGSPYNRRRLKSISGGAAFFSLLLSKTLQGRPVLSATHARGKDIDAWGVCFLTLRYPAFSFNDEWRGRKGAEQRRDARRVSLGGHLSFYLVHFQGLQKCFACF